MWFLIGLGRNSHVIELVIVTFERERFIGPSFYDYLEAFVKAASTLFERRIEPLMNIRECASTDPEFHSASTDQV